MASGPASAELFEADSPAGADEDDYGLDGAPIGADPEPVDVPPEDPLPVPFGTQTDPPPPTPPLQPENPPPPPFPPPLACEGLDCGLQTREVNDNSVVIRCAQSSLHIVCGCSRKRTSTHSSPIYHAC